MLGVFLVHLGCTLSVGLIIGNPDPLLTPVHNLWFRALDSNLNSAICLSCVTLNELLMFAVS